ncbi:hypothetical protein P5673_022630, partial [Acropora cervicornis]
LDNISAYLLKEAAPITESSLTHIINLSLCSGIFPNNLRIASVTPIFGEGLKSHPNRYRPSSVMTVVSKLIKRIVFKQLTEYLNNNNLFPSRFRPMFSTETALLENAFDVIDYIIMLGKLSLYGVSSHPVNWFQSYR